MNITKHNMTILMLSAALLPAASSYALDASHYADNSALATGKWAKVSVSGAGMQLITDTQLRAMGFDDPGKVHVYGTGGRQLTYGLTTANADDLPLLPSVRTQKGIVFFRHRPSDMDTPQQCIHDPLLSHNARIQRRDLLLLERP